MSKSVEKIVVQSSHRTEVGRRQVAKIRAQHKLPAVLYGHTTPLAITVDSKQIHSMIDSMTGNVIIDLMVGDKEHHAILKEFQTHPISNQIVHLDFYEIEKGKKLKTHVRLTLEGSAVGVREGGVLEQPINDIEIECLPKDLPHELPVDITELQVGESLKVSDVVLPSGITVLSNLEQVVAHIAVPRLTQEVAVEGDAVGEDEAAESSEAQPE